MSLIRLLKSISLILLPMLLFFACDAQDESTELGTSQHIHSADMGDGYLHGMLTDMTLSVSEVIALDDQDARCLSDLLASMACMEPRIEQIPNQGQQHIADKAISYEANPPSSGAHRPMWGKWGEYEYLPPQRWLHNLEHGGIVFLYHPCADPALIEELKRFVRDYQTEDQQAFRWILTPYPELPSAIAVVAWEWTYLAECVDSEKVGDFIKRTYRRAPEDVAADGSFTFKWMSR
jgi:hypothetical protein